MYFQVLDNKQDCYGFFHGGTLYRKHLPVEATRTWRYSLNLNDGDAEFAYLYCGGKELREACPEDLLEDYQVVSDKMRAFVKSFTTAKVSLDENCFYDLVPEKFLLRYFDIKNKITRHVFETYPRPENYEFLADLDVLLAKISSQELNFDKERLRKFYHLPGVRPLLKAIARGKNSIHYNLFGTKTGRLTTAPKSFPILTLKKELRSVLRPQNDWFVEIDYNAAELRTLLALSGKEQPPDDLHEWNVKNVYQGLASREEAKKRIFAWLYNPDSKDYLSARAYDRDAVVEKYSSGSQITTPFNRVIPSDEHHALNYIIQSTTSDLFLRKAIETSKILEGSKTKIAFLLHDAIVLDFCTDDMIILGKILSSFPQTSLGNYKINVSAGDDLENMRKLL